jgi:hypothetical protein
MKFGNLAEAKCSVCLRHVRVRDRRITRMLFATCVVQDAVENRRTLHAALERMTSLSGLMYRNCVRNYVDIKNDDRERKLVLYL